MKKKLFYCLNYGLWGQEQASTEDELINEYPNSNYSIHMYLLIYLSIYLFQIEVISVSIKNVNGPELFQ